VLTVCDPGACSQSFDIQQSKSLLETLALFRKLEQHVQRPLIAVLGLCDRIWEQSHRTIPHRDIQCSV